MIPSGGDYFRLPIADSYRTKTKSLLTRDGGGRWLPVLGLIAARRVLQQHISGLAESLNLLTDEDFEDETVLARLQSALIPKFGLSFFVQKGNLGWFCGAFPDAEHHLIELMNRGNNLPGLSLDKLAMIHVVGPDGLTTSKPVPADEFIKRTQSLEKTFETSDEIPLVELSKIVTKATLTSLTPDNIQELLTRYYPKKVARELAGGSNLDDQHLIIAATIIVLKHAKRHGLARPELEEYPEEVSESVDAASLTEARLRELVDLTASNGFYRYGGLRRVRGRWVMDPSVPGRVANSRFVVVNTPRWTLGPDGLPVLNFVCRSRPDRNTTGLRQAGFIRVINRGNIFRRAIGRFLPSVSVGEPDVHVFCSCPDFKYRFHFLLAKMGAAAVPTGTGGQATNQPPVKTNPNGRVSLCKHLTACASIVNFAAPEYRNVLRTQRNSPVEPTGPREEPVVKPGAQVTRLAVPEPPPSEPQPPDSR